MIDVLKDLYPAKILRRINRFVVEVDTERGAEKAHNTNTGRLKDLLIRGRKAFLQKIRCKNKKSCLSYRIIAVEDLYEYAIIDTITQNKIFEKIVETDILDYLRGFKIIRRNPRIGTSVFDYLLKKESKSIIIETKSAVFRGSNGEAMYPDAPTERGRRHFKELTNLKREGIETGIIFIAAFKSPTCFRIYEEIDPQLKDLFIEALKNNVMIKAFSIYMNSRGEIFLENPDLPLCPSMLRETFII